MQKRFILHVDMDAFYASIEQRDNPELKGKPVIIGADPKGGRGVVSTASYEARRYGVRSAMPISRAYKLCPHGAFLPVCMEKYKVESKKIMQIFKAYTFCIETIALDEAFLDLTNTNYDKDIFEIAKEVQNRIYTETGLTASVGLSYNKFLAKLASDLKKPKGFTVIHKKDIEKVVWPLPVDKLWGVGPKTKEILFNMGITTIESLAKSNPKYLNRKLGELGYKLYFLAHGIDDRSVESENTIKSMGKETTFKIDTNNLNLLFNILLKLSEDVGYRLREEGHLCQTLVIKLRYSDFKTITRSYTLKEPTNLDDEIYEIARYLLEKNWNRKPLRLIGLTAERLFYENSKQISLFDYDGKNLSLNKTIDEIRLKYGLESIKRARILTNNPPKGE